MDIHRYFIPSWRCTPGNCSGHYALCLMVGLVEGLTRVSVVVCAGDERGTRSSKQETLLYSMWSALPQTTLGTLFTKAVVERGA